MTTHDSINERIVYVPNNVQNADEVSFVNPRAS